ncbi:hypothetical protein [Klebsiella michiganensis]|uniref:hypothetical protein n=1 Tax=Klebsiella michiganensis TaxID=1134687 RepID=UPI00388FB57B
MNSVRYRDAKVIAMLAGDRHCGQLIIRQRGHRRASGTGTGSSASASVITE